MRAGKIHKNYLFVSFFLYLTLMQCFDNENNKNGVKILKIITYATCDAREHCSCRLEKEIFFFIFLVFFCCENNGCSSRFRSRGLQI